MTVLLTPEQVYSRAISLHEKGADARCIAFQFQGRWTGPERRDAFRFYHCESSLDVRAALDEPEERGTVKVILSAVNEEALGQDVLVRLFKRRLHPLKRSEVLRSVFGARQIDRGIASKPELVEALIEYSSIGTSNPATTGSLSLDAAWAFVLNQAIGLQAASPDLEALLEWTCDDKNLNRFRDLAEDRRELVLSHLGELGLGAKEFCALLRSEYPPLAAALVCGVIYHTAAEAGLHKAEGKAEDRFFKGIQPTKDGVRKLAAASESVARASGADEALVAAEDLLAKLGARDFAHLSPVLRSGYEQRLAALAHKIMQACRTPNKEASRAVLAARDLIRAHHFAATDPQEVARIDMAIRLLLWHETQEQAPSELPKTLEQAAQEYAREGSFVDWARYSLIPGSRNRELELAFREICQRVDVRRELFAKHFARLLAGTTGSVASDVLLPIEHLMRDLVAPIAHANPVLVLVVDGMSWAVWREVATSLPGAWIRLAPRNALTVALATIPSVTEVSRCSLFCGDLRLGDSEIEAKGFKSHPDLVAAGQHNRPPLLLHKSSLKNEGEAGLADEVRDAIADKNRRVVGVVVNAVDDNLLKGDQLVLNWSVEAVQPLAALLEEARLAARHVVILSDHGHVLEIGSESRKGAGGERWKEPGAPLDGEIAIEGSRVLTEHGNRLVAPWSDLIRYGPKRNGYHGGVSPQEMLIPVAVLRHESAPAIDMDELVEQQPGWWNCDASVDATGSVAVVATKRAKVLFEVPEPAKKRIASPAWLPALLNSPVLKAQSDVAGRRPLNRDELTSLLSVLAMNGGVLTEVALSRELKMARFRLGGFITVAQRMLNVDGFEVLSRDEESETIKLNQHLLKSQFELT